MNDMCQQRSLVQSTLLRYLGNEAGCLYIDAPLFLLTIHRV